ncbi:MAG: ATP-binding protein, partial [bacterium]|nr:ATP-binding protein [bacterium]
MAFSEIIGQQRVKSILKRAVANNRLPHALLLYGPEGVGKTATAL